MRIADGSAHRKSLAAHLVAYWKTRGMRYSQKWAEGYIASGHKKEIAGDKFFVALENGCVVGSISVVVWKGGLAELRDFYVTPACRNKGIGRALFEKALRFCEKKKARKVHAKVFPQYMEFFKEYGFAEEGILKSHFADGEDLLVVGKFMKK